MSRFKRCDFPIYLFFRFYLLLISFSFFCNFNLCIKCCVWVCLVKSASKSIFIILALCSYFYKESSSLLEFDRLWGRKIILPEPELFFLVKDWSLLLFFRPIPIYTLFYLFVFYFFPGFEFVLLESSVALVWSNVLLMGTIFIG